MTVRRSLAVSMRALALAIGSAGCASAGSVQTAHTLGRGNAQLGLELSEQALVSRYSLTAYPMFGVAGRYGVSDRVDLGARVGSSGGELQAKVMLTPPPPAIVVSLAPSSGLWAYYKDGIWLASYNLQLPVLIGVPLPHEHQLVLGPRLHESAFYASFGSAKGLVTTTYVGSSAGVAWKMPTTKTTVRLLTEIACLYPVAVAVDRTDDVGGVAWFGGKWIVQANLGFLLGGR